MAGSLQSVVVHFTRNGVDPANAGPAAGRGYNVGEMGRISGSQDEPFWFGQIVSGGGSVGVQSLSINYRYDIAPTGSSFVAEVYGANDPGFPKVAPVFDLDGNEAPVMSPSWISLTSTEIATLGSSTGTNVVVPFNLGATGYDFVGVRLRSRNFGSSATELAFQSIQVIPEPSTAILLSGFLAIGLLRRQRI